MVKNPDFKYEIKENIAILSKKGNTSKELNLISYGDKPPVYDLRNWKVSADGERTFMRGLTFNREEAETLIEALTRHAFLKE